MIFAETTPGSVRISSSPLASRLPPPASRFPPSPFVHRRLNRRHLEEMRDDRGGNARRPPTVQTEFEKHCHDNFWMIGRREANEPAVVGATGVLRATCF